MGNRWKEIWNKRDIASAVSMQENQDEFQVYTQLKKLDGFDTNITDEEAYYRHFYDASLQMWTDIQNREHIESVYEVGCGSGANLYLLKNRGLNVGGMDYSGKLIEAAKKVLNGGMLEEEEAIKLTSDVKWDAVISDSVFAYFPDEKYGETVLGKMYDKANKVIAVLEVFDKALYEECNRHRRELVENYDELYKGLDKTFYDKDMFIRFADQHNCDLEFYKVENEYYWNSAYMYNCIFYKK